MSKIVDLITSFLESTGIVAFFQGNGWMNLIMILVGCVFLFLAIKKKFEPYLLIPIAFGIILANIPGAGVFVKQGIDANGLVITNNAGIVLEGHNLSEVVDYKYKHNSSEVEARQRVKDMHNRDLMRFIQILDEVIGKHD